MDQQQQLQDRQYALQKIAELQKQAAEVEACLKQPCDQCRKLPSVFRCDFLLVSFAIGAFEAT